MQEKHRKDKNIYVYVDVEKGPTTRPSYFWKEVYLRCMNLRIFINIYECAIFIFQLANLAYEIQHWEEVSIIFYSHFDLISFLAVYVYFCLETKSCSCNDSTAYHRSFRVANCSLFDNCLLIN